MFIKALKFSSLVALLITVSQTDSFANSIFLSQSNITLSLGNIDLRSYDGAGYNNIGKTVGNPSSFLEFTSFTGGAAGTQYDMFFLSSVADYKNNDEFGFLNEQGQFVSSISGASALGSKTTYTQAGNQTLQVGFKSPESLFYSQASKNADGKSHILGIQATANAVLTIPKADLQGNSISFNLLAGDILFFMEDMLFNSKYNGAPGSDFDYNDFLTVVRAKQAEVPEPATVCLLGLGALAAFKRRRKA